jgi:hypothetical protein
MRVLILGWHTGAIARLWVQSAMVKESCSHIHDIYGQYIYVQISMHAQLSARPVLVRKTMCANLNDTSS